MAMYNATRANGAITAVFSADLANVDRFCADAARLLAEHALQQHDFAVQLLLREGLNNAVIHGCRQDGARTVEAVLAIEERQIRIEIDDQGDGFPWLDILARAKDDKATSGRGLELFQNYANSFCYNNKGNHLTIRRSLSS